jgi:NADH-quinone oxidoreductase subunit L
MFRLYYMTFSHEYRGAQVEGIESSEPEHAGHSLIPDQRHLDQGDEHLDKGHGHHLHAHEPHESPASMTGVLWILATLSIIGGFYFGWPSIWGGRVPTVFQRWLEPILLPLGPKHYHFHEGSAGVEWLLIGSSVFVALLGWFLAYSFYYRDRSWRVPTMAEVKLWPIHRLLFNKYYVDEIYNATVVAGTLAFSRFLWWFDVWIVDGLVNLTRHITVIVLGFGSNLFDRYVVDGAVNGVAYTARGGSKMFRRVQSGVVQNYALIMGGGIVVIAVIYLFLKPAA